MVSSALSLTIDILCTSQGDSFFPWVVQRKESFITIMNLSRIILETIFIQCCFKELEIFLDNLGVQSFHTTAVKLVSLSQCEFGMLLAKIGPPVLPRTIFLVWAAIIAWTLCNSLCKGLYHCASQRSHNLPYIPDKTWEHSLLQVLEWCSVLASYHVWYALRLLTAPKMICTHSHTIHHHLYPQNLLIYSGTLRHD